MPKKRQSAKLKQQWHELNQRVIDCQRCPRLIDYCQQIGIKKKKQFATDDYWAKPLPGFGDVLAEVLIVGLAPAAHGANRTGRMFTGDGTDGMGSSDFLTRTLYRAGFANQNTSRHAKDGLKLTNLFISTIARCAPPENKLTTQKIANCKPYLIEEIKLLTNLKVIVALGKTSFDHCLRISQQLGAELSSPKPKFSHGMIVELGESFPTLIASYHPSRQNTQTKRLTEGMFLKVFEDVKLKL